MVGKHALVPFVLSAITGTSAATLAQQSTDQLPSGLREAVIDAIYAVARTDGETWMAPNPAQGMQSTFTPEEGVLIEGSDGEGAWGLSLELEAWGRPSALVPVGAVEPVAHGRRVEYRRGPLTEWYVNDTRGLEQGFTLEERPVGEGPLEIVLAVGIGFAAEVRPGGRDALLTDRATGSMLHYSGLRAWDSAQRELEASLSIQGGRLELRIEDDGAAYPVHVDPWIATEEAKLTASDAADFDNFGASVALSGDTAVVGAAFDDHGSGADAGAAYVFARNGTIWSEQQKLTASDAAAGDRFGTAVALSGDTAVIGALNDDHASGTDAGSVYVFVRSGTTWSEQTKLTSSDAAAGDEFGGSLALSGETAVVGAIFDEHSGVSGAGSAYVFVRSGTTWSEQAKLTAGDAALNDHFGNDVDVSGDTAVVGAPYDNHAGGADAGSAYVFVQSGTTWSEKARLTASDAQSFALFGASVALSGDTAVIGALLDDHGGADAGSAYVFVQSGMSWSEQSKLTASDASAGDRFGDSVAVLGNTAVVGASNAGSGSAYVFVQGGTTWSEEVKILSSDGTNGDGFGGSVALSGDTAVVGAWKDDHEGGSNAGSAYVFRLLPGPMNYCTAGTSASGCQALLSATGTPSASAASGFLLQATGVEGSKDGAFFWGKSGKQANPWGNGTSFQCVVPPVTRGGPLTGTGTNGACDGSFAQDLNATWCSTCPYPQKNPGFGTVVQAQLWYRDPLSTSNQTTSLSDAIEFQVDP